MANSLIPNIDLAETTSSRHFRSRDSSKEPIFDDFNSLIEQAVTYQGVSGYNGLNESMRWALGIAALRENKPRAIDAEYPGFNQLLAKVFESKGSQDSLQKLYQYLVGVVMEGNKNYEAQVAYCIDNALEKEVDKQAFNAKYFRRYDEFDYNKERYLNDYKKEEN